MQHIDISSSERRSNTLSEKTLNAAVAAFRRDGYVCLADVIDTDHIDGVKAAYSPLASGCIILTSEHEPQVKHVENTVYTAPRRIIVVLLGSPTPFKEGLSLTRHGWSLYDKWAQAGRSLHFRRFL